MTVGELIRLLSEFEQEMQVCVADRDVGDVGESFLDTDHDGNFAWFVNIAQADLVTEERATHDE